MCAQQVSQVKRRRTDGARRVHPWAALVVLMLPVLLVAVDNTVLAFAVPAISEALTPTGTELLWIIDVYPLVLAGLLVPMGSLGDRVGRRRMLLIGGIGFSLVSVAAAFVPSAALLIVSRAAMGFFGAMLMPATLSLIRNIFTDPIQRRTAIAVWASGFSAGAALGPIVGGFLLEHFWWGSIFLLAVPLLVPLVMLAPVLVPESRDPNPGPIDPVSTLLVLVTLVPVLVAIKSMARDGISVTAGLLVLVGVLVGVAFVRRQLFSPTPMLDVRLFRNGVFSGSVAANLLSVFSLVGFLFFVSQHLQLVRGFSPMTAGFMLLPGLVVTIAAGLAVVRIARHVSTGVIVASGLLMNAGGYAIIIFAGPAGSDLGLVLAFVCIGAGVGAAETLSNDLILGSVPPEKAGAASAISETAYELGAVLGTAVLGSILTAAYRASVVVPGGIGGPAAAVASETLGGAHEVAATLSAERAQALLASAHTAFDSGVVVTSAIGVVLMLGAAVMVLRVLPREVERPAP